MPPSSDNNLLSRLRRADPDRHFSVLFAPAEKRERLALLYLFNNELARAREVASNPMLALIRLQWWREVVQGSRKKHELATPLSDALDAGLLPREELLALVDAREAEADDQIPDMQAFLAYARGTGGGWRALLAKSWGWIAWRSKISALPMPSPAYCGRRPSWPNRSVPCCPPTARSRKR